MLLCSVIRRSRVIEMKTLVKSVRSTREAERDLESNGFTRTFGARYKAWITLGAVIAIITVSITAQCLFSVLEPNMAVVLITIGGLVLACQQWLDARREESLEKFYERLEVTNQLLDSWKAARRFAGPWPSTNRLHKKDAEQEYQCARYVYRELDNLEYAVEKYRLGYMKAEHAHRCLRTFYARCQYPEFRKLALQCVKDNYGYSCNISKVVEQVNCRIEQGFSVYTQHLDTRQVIRQGGITPDRKPTQHFLAELKRACQVL